MIQGNHTYSPPGESLSVQLCRGVANKPLYELWRRFSVFNFKKRHQSYAAYNVVKFQFILYHF